MTITDLICIIEKTKKDISKSVFWKAFRISTKNFSVIYTLTCICLTSYTSSASCSCWFSLRKGAILSTVADKSKTDCNEIKAEFCRDDFLWNLLVPRSPSCRSILFQTISNSVKHVSTAFLIEFHLRGYDGKLQVAQHFSSLFVQILLILVQELTM